MVRRAAMRELNFIHQILLINKGLNFDGTPASVSACDCRGDLPRNVGIPDTWIG
jgi:hypothetical protein